MDRQQGGFSMSQGTPKTAPSGGTGGAAKWWCNFCDFKTDDQKAYLAHSCQEVLKQQGRTPQASGKSSCG
jgi:hypothetical protein